MCEAWNEAGESTQTVRVTIKGKINIHIKNFKKFCFFFFK
jgi:hypothetical protein